MASYRTSILTALGLTAAAAVVAIVPSAAGAIDQDLVVTPTSGPPGTEITVSSASCTTSGDGEAYLEVALITGTAPNEQLAGIGQSYDGDSATVVVPDWVDPDQPAVLEAWCSLYDPETDTGDELTYDPVAFDVEPGSGTPVQVRTLSREELLAGQGLEITGSCGPDHADGMAVAIVYQGTDQSGRQFEGYAGDGVAAVEADGSFEVPVIVNNSTVGFEVSSSEGVVQEINAYEEPMDIPPGDYTVMTSCSDDSDSILFLQPALLTVTGSAPTDLVDLTSTDGGRSLAMAGECDAEVSGWLDGISADDLMDDFDVPVEALRSHPASRSRVAQLTSAPTEAGRIQGRPGQHLRTPSGRAIGGNSAVDFTVTPEGGTWEYADEAAFDQGIVAGQAVCGDPFADGFAYDAQGLAIDVAEPPTTTTTTTTTAPAPAPANAVAGTPTYAG